MQVYPGHPGDFAERDKPDFRKDLIFAPLRIVTDGKCTSVHIGLKEEFYGMDLSAPDRTGEPEMIGGNGQITFLADFPDYGFTQAAAKLHPSTGGEPEIMAVEPGMIGQQQPFTGGNQAAGPNPHIPRYSGKNSVWHYSCLEVNLWRKVGNFASALKIYV